MHDAFLRLELFDDEIESLRLIDPETQRTLQNIDNNTLEPYAEYIVEASEREELLSKIDELYEQTAERLEGVTKEALEEYYDVVTHPDQLGNHLAQFAHLLEDHDKSLLDYLTPAHRVFVDDVNAVKTSYDAEFEAVHNYFASVKIGRAHV